MSGKSTKRVQIEQRIAELKRIHETAPAADSWIIRSEIAWLEDRLGDGR